MITPALHGQIVVTNNNHPVNVALPPPLFPMPLPPRPLSIEIMYASLVAASALQYDAAAATSRDTGAAASTSGPGGGGKGRGKASRGNGDGPSGIQRAGGAFNTFWTHMTGEAAADVLQLVLPLSCYSNDIQLPFSSGVYSNVHLNKSDTKAAQDIGNAVMNGPKCESSNTYSSSTKSITTTSRRQRSHTAITKSSSMKTLFNKTSGRESSRKNSILSIAGTNSGCEEDTDSSAVAFKKSIFHFSCGSNPHLSEYRLQILSLSISCYLGNYYIIPNNIILSPLIHQAATILKKQGALLVSNNNSDVVSNAVPKGQIIISHLLTNSSKLRHFLGLLISGCIDYGQLSISSTSNSDRRREGNSNAFSPSYTKYFSSIFSTFLAGTKPDSRPALYNNILSLVGHYLGLQIGDIGALLASNNRAPDGHDPDYKNRNDGNSPRSRMEGNGEARHAARDSNYSSSAGDDVDSVSYFNNHLSALPMQYPAPRTDRYSVPFFSNQEKVAAAQSGIAAVKGAISINTNNSDPNQALISRAFGVRRVAPSGDPARYLPLPLPALLAPFSMPCDVIASSHEDNTDSDANNGDHASGTSYHYLSRNNLLYSKPDRFIHSLITNINYSCAPDAAGAAPPQCLNAHSSANDNNSNLDSTNSKGNANTKDSKDTSKKGSKEIANPNGSNIGHINPNTTYPNIFLYGSSLRQAQMLMTNYIANQDASNEDKGSNRPGKDGDKSSPGKKAKQGINSNSKDNGSNASGPAGAGEALSIASRNHIYNYYFGTILHYKDRIVLSELLGIAPPQDQSAGQREGTSPGAGGITLDYSSATTIANAVSSDMEHPGRRSTSVTGHPNLPEDSKRCFGKASNLDTIHASVQKCQSNTNSLLAAPGLPIPPPSPGAIVQGLTSTIFTRAHDGHGDANTDVTEPYQNITIPLLNISEVYMLLLVSLYLKSYHGHNNIYAFLNSGASSVPETPGESSPAADIIILDASSRPEISRRSNNKKQRHFTILKGEDDISYNTSQEGWDALERDELASWASGCGYRVANRGQNSSHNTGLFYSYAKQRSEGDYYYRPLCHSHLYNALPHNSPNRMPSSSTSPKRKLSQVSASDIQSHEPQGRFSLKAHPLDAARAAAAALGFAADDHYDYHALFQGDYSNNLDHKRRVLLWALSRLIARVYNNNYDRGDTRPRGQQANGEYKLPATEDIINIINNNYFINILAQLAVDIDIIRDGRVEEKGDNSSLDMDSDAIISNDHSRRYLRRAHKRQVVGIMNVISRLLNHRDAIIHNKGNNLLITTYEPQTVVATGTAPEDDAGPSLLSSSFTKSAHGANSAGQHNQGGGKPFYYSTVKGYVTPFISDANNSMIKPICGSYRPNPTLSSYVNWPNEARLVLQFPSYACAMNSRVLRPAALPSRRLAGRDDDTTILAINVPRVEEEVARNTNINIADIIAIERLLLFGTCFRHFGAQGTSPANNPSSNGNDLLSVTQSSYIMSHFDIEYKLRHMTEAAVRRRWYTTNTLPGTSLGRINHSSSNNNITSINENNLGNVDTDTISENKAPKSLVHTEQADGPDNEKQGVQSPTNINSGRPSSGGSARGKSSSKLSQSPTPSDIGLNVSINSLRSTSSDSHNDNGSENSNNSCNSVAPRHRSARQATAPKPNPCIAVKNGDGRPPSPKGRGAVPNASQNKPKRASHMKQESHGSATSRTRQGSSRSSASRPTSADLSSGSSRRANRHHPEPKGTAETGADRPGDAIGTPAKLNPLLLTHTNLAGGIGTDHNASKRETKHAVHIPSKKEANSSDSRIIPWSTGQALLLSDQVIAPLTRRNMTTYISSLALALPPMPMTFTSKGEDHDQAAEAGGAASIWQLFRHFSGYSSALLPGLLFYNVQRRLRDIRDAPTGQNLSVAALLLDRYRHIANSPSTISLAFLYGRNLDSYKEANACATTSNDDDRKSHSADSHKKNAFEESINIQRIIRESGNAAGQQFPHFNATGGSNATLEAKAHMNSIYNCRNSIKRIDVFSNIYSEKGKLKGKMGSGFNEDAASQDSDDSHNSDNGSEDEAVSAGNNSSLSLIAGRAILSYQRTLASSSLTPVPSLLLLLGLLFNNNNYPNNAELNSVIPQEPLIMRRLQGIERGEYETQPATKDSDDKDNLNTGMIEDTAGACAGRGMKSGHAANGFVLRAIKGSISTSDISNNNNNNDYTIYNHNYNWNNASETTRKVLYLAHKEVSSYKHHAKDMGSRGYRDDGTTGSGAAGERPASGRKTTKGPRPHSASFLGVDDGSSAVEGKNGAIAIDNIEHNVATTNTNANTAPCLAEGNSGDSSGRSAAAPSASVRAVTPTDKGKRRSKQHSVVFIQSSSGEADKSDIINDNTARRIPETAAMMPVKAEPSPSKEAHAFGEDEAVAVKSTIYKPLPHNVKTRNLRKMLLNKVLDAERYKQHTVTRLSIEPSSNDSGADSSICHNSDDDAANADKAAAKSSAGLLLPPLVPKSRTPPRPTSGPNTTSTGSFQTTATTVNTSNTTGSPTESGARDADMGAPPTSSLRELTLALSHPVPNTALLLRWCGTAVLFLSFLIIKVYNSVMTERLRRRHWQRRQIARLLLDLVKREAAIIRHNRRVIQNYYYRCHHSQPNSDKRAGQHRDAKYNYFIPGGLLAHLFGTNIIIQNFYNSVTDQDNGAALRAAGTPKENQRKSLLGGNRNITPTNNAQPAAMVGSLRPQPRPSSASSTNLGATNTLPGSVAAASNLTTTRKGATGINLSPQQQWLMQLNTSMTLGVVQRSLLLLLENFAASREATRQFYSEGVSPGAGPSNPGSSYLNINTNSNSSHQQSHISASNNSSIIISTGNAAARRTVIPSSGNYTFCLNNANNMNKEFQLALLNALLTLGGQHMKRKYIKLLLSNDYSASPRSIETADYNFSDANNPFFFNFRALHHIVDPAAPTPLLLSALGLPAPFIASLSPLLLYNVLNFGTSGGSGYYGYYTNSPSPSNGASSNAVNLAAFGNSITATSINNPTLMLNPAFLNPYNYIKHYFMGVSGGTADHDALQKINGSGSLSPLIGLPVLAGVLDIPHGPCHGLGETDDINEEGHDHIPKLLQLSPAQQQAARTTLSAPSAILLTEAATTIMNDTLLRDYYYRVDCRSTPEALAALRVMALSLLRGSFAPPLLTRMISRKRSGCSDSGKEFPSMLPSAVLKGLQEVADINHYNSEQWQLYNRKATDETGTYSNDYIGAESGNPVTRPSPSAVAATPVEPPSLKPLPPFLPGVLRHHYGQPTIPSYALATTTTVTRSGGTTGKEKDGKEGGSAKGDPKERDGAAGKDTGLSTTIPTSAEARLMALFNGWHVTKQPPPSTLATLVESANNSNNISPITMSNIGSLLNRSADDGSTASEDAERHQEEEDLLAALMTCNYYAYYPGCSNVKKSTVNSSVLAAAAAFINSYDNRINAKKMNVSVEKASSSDEAPGKNDAGKDDVKKANSEKGRRGSVKVAEMSTTSTVASNMAATPTISSVILNNEGSHRQLLSTSTAVTSKSLALLKHVALPLTPVEEERYLSSLPTHVTVVVWAPSALTVPVGDTLGPAGLVHNTAMFSNRDMRCSAPGAAERARSNEGGEVYMFPMARYRLRHVNIPLLTIEIEAVYDETASGGEGLWCRQDIAQRTRRAWRRLDAEEGCRVLADEDDRDIDTLIERDINSYYTSSSSSEVDLNDPGKDSTRRRKRRELLAARRHHHKKGLITRLVQELDELDDAEDLTSDTDDGGKKGQDKAPSIVQRIRSISFNSNPGESDSTAKDGPAGSSTKAKEAGRPGKKSLSSLLLLSLRRHRPATTGLMQLDGLTYDDINEDEMSKSSSFSSSIDLKSADSDSNINVAGGDAELCNQSIESRTSTSTASTVSVLKSTPSTVYTNIVSANPVNSSSEFTGSMNPSLNRNKSFALGTSHNLDSSFQGTAANGSSKAAANTVSPVKRRRSLAPAGLLAPPGAAPASPPRRGDSSSVWDMLPQLTPQQVGMLVPRPPPHAAPLVPISLFKKLMLSAAAGSAASELLLSQVSYSFSRAHHCRRHGDEPFSYYCHTCKVICCTSCALEAHRDHLMPLEDADGGRRISNNRPVTASSVASSATGAVSRPASAVSSGAADFAAENDDDSVTSAIRNRYRTSALASLYYFCRDERSRLLSKVTVLEERILLLRQMLLLLSKKAQEQHDLVEKTLNGVVSNINKRVLELHQDAEVRARQQHKVMLQSRSLCMTERRNIITNLRTIIMIRGGQIADTRGSSIATQDSTAVSNRNNNIASILSLLNISCQRDAHYKMPSTAPLSSNMEDNDHPDEGARTPNFPVFDGGEMDTADGGILLAPRAAPGGGYIIYLPGLLYPQHYPPLYTISRLRIPTKAILLMIHALSWSRPSQYLAPVIYPPDMAVMGAEATRGSTRRESGKGSDTQLSYQHQKYLQEVNFVIEKGQFSDLDAIAERSRRLNNTSDRVARNEDDSEDDDYYNYRYYKHETYGSARFRRRRRKVIDAGSARSGQVVTEPNSNMDEDEHNRQESGHVRYECYYVEEPEAEVPECSTARGADPGRHLALPTSQCATAQRLQQYCQSAARSALAAANSLHDIEMKNTNSTVSFNYLQKQLLRQPTVLASVDSSNSSAFSAFINDKYGKRDDRDNPAKTAGFESMTNARRIERPEHYEYRYHYNYQPYKPLMRLPVQEEANERAARAEIQNILIHDAGYADGTGWGSKSIKL